MKLAKLIGTVGLAAFAASVIPFRFKKDKETGAMEARSLLWGVKKTPGEAKDHITFAIPSSGLDSIDTEEAPAEEAPAEEAEATEAPAESEKAEEHDEPEATAEPEAPAEEAVQ